MKKIALYILAAAAVFAGCSKNNINTSPVDPEDAWMYDATLPVPIRFSAGNGAFVKSTIETVADMEGKTFGFFAINSGKSEAEGLGGWDADIKNLPMPIQNATAKCAVVEGTEKVKFNFFETQEDGTEVPTTYYYDQKDWTPYTFYGYHAELADTPEVQQSYIRMPVKLGRTDILWGKAEAEEYQGYYGYNARYIRKTNGTKQPYMTFKHLTACVNFTAQVVTSEQGGNAGDIAISEFKLENVPVKAYFYIAHRGSSGNPSVEGTIRPLAESKGALPWTVEEPMSLTVEPQPLGDSFFLCPEPAPIAVSMVYTFAGKEYPTTFNINDGETSSTGLQAGYRYNYNVKIYAPEQIVIEATVEPYVDAWTTPEDIEIDK